MCKDYYETNEDRAKERRKVRGPENVTGQREESAYEESVYEESRVSALSHKSGPVTRTYGPVYEYIGPYQLCCVSGYTVKITFLHYRPEEITVALVEFESSDGSVYLSATEAVSRYYLDEHDDHLARKYALRKALKRLRPDKALRQTAWLAFYTGERLEREWVN